MVNAEGERPADVLIKNGVIEAVQANLTVRSLKGCTAELHAHYLCVNFRSSTHMQSSCRVKIRHGSVMK